MRLDYASQIENVYQGYKECVDEDFKSSVTIEDLHKIIHHYKFDDNRCKTVINQLFKTEFTNKDVLLKILKILPTRELKYLLISHMNNSLRNDEEFMIGLMKIECVYEGDFRSLYFGDLLGDKLVKDRDFIYKVLNDTKIYKKGLFSDVFKRFGIGNAEDNELLKDRQLMGDCALADSKFFNELVKMMPEYKSYNEFCLRYLIASYRQDDIQEFCEKVMSFDVRLPDNFLKDIKQLKKSAKRIYEVEYKKGPLAYLTRSIATANIGIMVENIHLSLQNEALARYQQENQQTLGL